MFNCCLAKSTVHKNWNNSKRGRKWQPKISQNMQKPSSNQNVCFKMRHKFIILITDKNKYIGRVDT